MKRPIKILLTVTSTALLLSLTACGDVDKTAAPPASSQADTPPTPKAIPTTVARDKLSPALRSLVKDIPIAKSKIMAFPEVKSEVTKPTGLFAAASDVVPKTWNLNASRYDYEIQNGALTVTLFDTDKNKVRLNAKDELKINFPLKENQINKTLVTDAKKIQTAVTKYIKMHGATPELRIMGKVGGVAQATATLSPAVFAEGAAKSAPEVKISLKSRLTEGNGVGDTLAGEDFMYPLEDKTSALKINITLKAIKYYTEVTVK